MLIEASEESTEIWEISPEFVHGLAAMTPGNPGTTLGSSDFGKVTSLAAGTAPRVMQFGVKYTF